MLSPERRYLKYITLAETRCGAEAQLGVSSSRASANTTPKLTDNKQHIESYQIFYLLATSNWT